MIFSRHSYSALNTFCLAEWLLILAMLVWSSPLFSQYSVKFRVMDVTGKHYKDSIFVAGDFNQWNPAANGNLLDELHEAQIEMPGSLEAGRYQYKITRGSWQSVECSAGGVDINNRELVLTSDTIITIYPTAWKDDFPSKTKASTASRNVRLVDTAFVAPQLGDTRRIWIYLPPGYRKGSKRYPVMYLQDGQNVFDESTSSFGEWGADETADAMTAKGKPACIIVAIANGPKRITDYNPWYLEGAGEGAGDQYVDFLVKTLKPYIDKRYRTLPNSDNTIIAGSSMGGLIAYYAMLKYPLVFGKGGIFSPAFWTAEEIKTLTDTAGSKLNGTLFFYMGEKEGDRHLENMTAVTDKLGENSKALLYVVTDPLGDHNEAAWRKWFPEFYNWVLAIGFNNIIQPDRP